MAERIEAGMAGSRRRWRCNTVVCKREALELSSKAFSRLRRTSLNHKTDRWNSRGKTQAPAARAGKRLRDMSARQTVRADRSLPELQSVSSGDLAQPL